MPLDTLAGGVEACVIELASKSGDYRLLFWRNTTESVKLDFGQWKYNVTHVDWWGMEVFALLPLTGKVVVGPPSGADSILQFVRNE